MLRHITFVVDVYPYHMVFFAGDDFTLTSIASARIGVSPFYCNERQPHEEFFFSKLRAYLVSCSKVNYTFAKPQQDTPVLRGREQVLRFR